MPMLLLQIIRQVVCPLVQSLVLIPTCSNPNPNSPPKRLQVVVLSVTANVQNKTVRLSVHSGNVEISK